MPNIFGYSFVQKKTYLSHTGLNVNRNETALNMLQLPQITIEVVFTCPSKTPCRLSSDISILGCGSSAFPKADNSLSIGTKVYWALCTAATQAQLSRQGSRWPINPIGLPPQIHMLLWTQAPPQSSWLWLGEPTPGLLLWSPHVTLGPSPILLFHDNILKHRARKGA